MSRIISAFLIMLGISACGQAIENGLSKLGEDVMTANGYKLVIEGPWYNRTRYEWIKQ